MQVVCHQLVDNPLDIPVQQAGILAGVVPVALVRLQNGSRQAFAQLGGQIAEQPLYQAAIPGLVGGTENKFHRCILPAAG